MRISVKKKKKKKPFLFFPCDSRQLGVLISSASPRSFMPVSRFFFSSLDVPIDHLLTKPSATGHVHPDVPWASQVLPVYHVILFLPKLVPCVCFLVSVSGTTWHRGSNSFPTSVQPPNARGLNLTSDGAAFFNKPVPLAVAILQSLLCITVMIFELVLVGRMMASKEVPILIPRSHKCVSLH